jgi:hypothetical protein
VPSLTEAGRSLVAAAAGRHGVSAEAAKHVLLAIAAGGGTQAQFNHPDLGGMGQWSRGGMIMVGDMFNQALKARVDALCTQLSDALRDASLFACAPVATQSQSQSDGQAQSSGIGDVSLFVDQAGSNRWPADLGAAASTGSQNDLHYAVFPQARRLAIERLGKVTVYDTGDHRIQGFSQQQGGNQTLTFTSQFGLVRLADLPIVTQGASDAPTVPVASPPPTEPPAPAHATQSAPLPSAGHRQTSGPGPCAVQSGDEIFTWLERLSALRDKGVITPEEFEAKKAELLARL